jgi:hypothetical protein
MAAAAAAKEALWLRKLSADFGLNQICVLIRGDNQAALTLITNKVISTKSKHIDIQHHFVRERVARGEIKFEYVSTEEQAADIFTKALPEPKFHKFRQMLGVCV